MTMLSALPFILIGINCVVLGMIALWVLCALKASRYREEAELEAALENAREMAASLAAQVPDGDEEETKKFNGKFLE